jgi:hypothetical protein
MSRKGNCWDNAVAESFFATLKVKSVYQNQGRTRTQARTELFEYIELFYEPRRRAYPGPTQSSLDEVFNPAQSALDTQNHEPFGSQRYARVQLIVESL